MSSVVRHPVVTIGRQFPSSQGWLTDSFSFLGPGEGEEEEEEEGHLILGLVEPVGQGRRRRLVDHSQHVQAGDLAGVLSRLPADKQIFLDKSNWEKKSLHSPLAVVEVGGHGDHGVLGRGAQVALGSLLHLGQHERANLQVNISKNIQTERNPGDIKILPTWLGEKTLPSVDCTQASPLLALQIL